MKSESNRRIKKSALEIKSLGVVSLNSSSSVKKEDEEIVDKEFMRLKLIESMVKVNAWEEARREIDDLEEREVECIFLNEGIGERKTRNVFQKERV